MPSSYPSGLDALTNPLPGDSTVTVSHAAQHGNANDAIEAIQAVLGLNPQGASASVGARCAALESGKASLSGSPVFTGTLSAAGLAGALLSSASPIMDDGTAAPGTATVPARQDHVHPSDTAKASLSGATFTGDTTVSKASPTLGVNATSGDPIITIDGAAGTLRSVRFRTGTSLRWLFGASSTAESGSDAGSDFRLRRYNDVGAVVSDPFFVWRNTGKVTFGDVGASAGLEYGTSGPRDMVGTGSPEGVVTAPVGSTWRDTNATTGAIRWIKTAGSGNTGWVVDYGDTGRRNIATLATVNATATYSVIHLRRSGQVVHLALEIANSVTSTAHEFLPSLPAGFKPATGVTFGGGRNTSTLASTAQISVSASGQSYMYAATASFIYAAATWITDEAWPSSLPGTAA